MGRTFFGACLREIVTVRFPVCDGERDECVMAVVMEVYTGFRVEEVPVLMNVQLFLGFVIVSLNGVMDPTVLLVQIAGEKRGKTLGQFCVCVVV